MKKALLAGLAYWAFIFGLGLILGVVRTLWLAPKLGDATLAVLVELPFMLVASWFSAKELAERLQVDSQMQRIVMGLFAFVLLIVTEAYLGLFLMGQPFDQWIAALLVLPGALGLFGQLMFGFIPSLLPLPRRVGES
jgi:hypothetical protein